MRSTGEITFEVNEKSLRRAVDQIREAFSSLAGIELTVRSAPPDLHGLAAMAMQAILADPTNDGIPVAHLAQRAHTTADAMLAERQRRALAARPPEWWCPSCQRVVDSTEVTHEERHQPCGAPVTAPPYQEAAPSPAGPVVDWIDWSAWKVCDRGYVLEIDDNRYEVRPQGEGFDLLWVEPREGMPPIEEVVSQSFAKPELAMAAARAEWNRCPTKENRP